METPSNPGKEPTPRELEILKVLWERGPGSVRLVHQQLLMREPDLAYNTVQTMLRLMETKGLVDHSLDGRTFVYTPRHSRDDTTRHFLERVLERVFDGAASQLMLSLLRTDRVSTEDLDRMGKLIAEARRRNRNSTGGPTDE